MEHYNLVDIKTFTLTTKSARVLSIQAGPGLANIVLKHILICCGLRSNIKAA